MSSRSTSYWLETNRPLVNLAFVAPFLVAYEAGLLWLGPAAMRNGADVWLRRLLEWGGFGQYFLLPTLTIGILLAWHHIRRDQWRIRTRVLYGMLMESIGFGGLLLFVANVHQSVLAIETAASVAGGRPQLGEAISYLGAGVYEELVFRMIVLTSCVAGIQKIGVSRSASWLWSVGISSLIFALAHYQMQVSTPLFEWAMLGGDPFEWGSFLFRFTAGTLFSALFLCRGFGITVGAHALYDILVGCC